MTLCSCLWRGPLPVRYLLRALVRGRCSRLAFLFFALALALSLSGCAPDLPRTPHSDPTAAGDDDGTLRLDIEPPSPPDAAPPILRARISSADIASVDLARVFFVEGEVTEGHLRQIEKGELSKALSDRLVPALAWLDEGEDGAGSSLIVAPTAPLTLGETYAVASGDPPFAIHLKIAPEDSAPHLERVWPPPDEGGTLRFGVWCGSEPLPPVAVESRLDPFGPAGALRRGAVDDVGARCLRFEAAPDAEAPEGAALVPPPALDVSGTLVRLDPRPFMIEGRPAALKPTSCQAEEIAFGPGCARVEDDRLHGRSPEAPLLWAISGAGLDHVFTTAHGDPFVVVGLPSDVDIVLAISAVDTEGTLLHNVVSSTTLAPMAHIVINEVLANPLGLEPTQEWVELVNDGTVSEELGGYVLEDIGGKTTLPQAELAPGRHAIIVNQGFVKDDGLDPIPAPRALILSVPKLGKGGLSNSGEPLKLTDISGRVVSRFPIGPRIKAGSSVARVAPWAPDELASSFKVAHPTPGARNGL